MLLYHGTSGEHLPDILLNGLVPRNPADGRWHNSELDAANPTGVYLHPLDEWAADYADRITSAWMALVPDEVAVVIEVEATGLRLCEDDQVTTSAYRCPDKIPPARIKRVIPLYNRILPRTEWMRDLQGKDLYC